ncbi:Fibronectin type III domain-containing protein [Terrisporobacter glycolicus]|nr:Fibronectin type III domain-containing protein [Terrisporobacter glycolicus]
MNNFKTNNRGGIKMIKFKRWLVSVLVLVLASTNIINIFALENNEMQDQLVKTMSTEANTIYGISDVSFTRLSDSNVGMRIYTNGAQGNESFTISVMGPGYRGSISTNSPYHNLELSNYGTYYITVSATDSIGNTAQINKQFYFSPPLRVTCNQSSNLVGLNEEVTLVATAYGGSGGSYEYKFTKIYNENEELVQDFSDINNINVSFSNEGQYKIRVDAKDKNGTISSVEKFITAIDREKDKPIITTDEDRVIKIGDIFDPMEDVVAIDKLDGNLISNVIVKENTVDTTKVGIYKVVYEVADSDGNTVTKEIKVTVRSDEKPVMLASDLELKIGEKYDPLKNVAASDKEDGDITSKIKVKENTVDTTKVGVYKVVYEVTDGDGNTVTKEIKVTLRSNDKSIISVSDVKLKVGDKFDPLKNVTASDNEDGDITSKIKVIENTVDTTKVGIYKVVYEVTDGDGNTVTKEIKVTVKLEVVSNIKAKSNSYNSNIITWSKVNNVDGYEIYRATSKTGTYSLNKTVTSGSYSNTGLTTGKTYYYKVRAYKVVDGKKQYGDFSQVVSSSPKLSSTTAKSASAAYNSNKVTWSKVSGASGYEVYRATSKTGKYSLKKTVKSGSTLSYSNTGLTTGKTYYYKVRAYKVVDGKKQYGNFSQVVSSSPKLFTPSVTLSKDSKKATVKWKKISGASGYEIYRSNSKSATYSKVKSVSRGSTTSYTNRGLTSKKVYYYKIRAYRTVNGKKVYSSYSSIKSIKAK